MSPLTNSPCCSEPLNPLHDILLQHDESPFCLTHNCRFPIILSSKSEFLSININSSEFLSINDLAGGRDGVRRQWREGSGQAAACGRGEVLWLRHLRAQVPGDRQGRHPRLQRGRELQSSQSVYLARPVFRLGLHVSRDAGQANLRFTEGGRL
jgi:hypothetical protein